MSIADQRVGNLPLTTDNEKDQMPGGGVGGYPGINLTCP